jgi:ubiquinone/menaquinone biosynthesis C-methylase UbiE
VLESIPSNALPPALSPRNPGNPTEAVRHERPFSEYAIAFEAGVPTKLELVEPWVRLETGGLLIDVGTGSGGVAARLAAGRRDAIVMALDNLPGMLEQARNRHRGHPNLHFAACDAEEFGGEEEQADTVMLLSLLHEVYAYRGRSLARVAHAIERSAARLKQRGRLLIKDFVRPRAADRPVLLHHLHADVRPGRSFADFATASPHAVRLESVQTHTDHVVYETTLGDCYEYLFRKDYTTTWTCELSERYGFWTSAEAVALVSGTGLIVRHAVEIDNTWVQENRVNGRVVVRDPRDGSPVPLKLSQLFLVAEKPAGRAVRRHPVPAGHFRSFPELRLGA